MVKRWTVGQSHFPCWAEGPSCETEAFPNLFIKMKKNNENSWHINTDLGCDVKTILHSDRKMKTGKDYQGVLRLDAEGIVDEYLSRDPHYTFVETLPWSTKRNPRVFNGKFISITRRPDGSLRPNFKPMAIDKNYSIERYTFNVYIELHKALKGLVEK